MKKELLYLDTSVVSAYYDRRAKERQEITTKFWKRGVTQVSCVYIRNYNRRIRKYQRENPKK